ncbi:MAG TPA: glycosyltransferase [Thermoanaerobaculia bacterium]|nr:glycosyltransferase [Thermoanaerobaculia bacterium]
MRTAAIVLAAASALLFAWSYGVYPALIAALAARPRSAAGSAAPSAPLPSVDVIVSAADEESVIGVRIANLLDPEVAGADPPGILVGCDGCRDGTADAARSAGGARTRVVVVEFPRRRGKASVVNDLVRTSSADVLVFTDANTVFEAGALDALRRRFEDPAVGAVCGRLEFETGAGARETPEAAYWDRETRSKEAEGDLGVCLGANGAIYAARRELVRPLPEDTTSMDDFLIPARVARAGRRVVFAGDAVAREDAARDVAAEAARRFRIGIGAGQVLRRELWLWVWPRHARLTLAFLSRKAARWLAPVLGLAAAAAALFVPGLRVVGAAVLAASALLLASARLRPALGGIAGRLYYFGVLNVALALGVSAGLVGYSRPAWGRTARA